MSWAAPLLVVAAPVLPEPRALSFTLYPKLADKFKLRKVVGKRLRAGPGVVPLVKVGVTVLRSK